MTAQTVRPENVVLDPEQRRRVRERVRNGAVACPGCGGATFSVGNALPLGFLFLNEEHGRYLVALTCTAPGCPTPHTGIRLAAAEFLLPGRRGPGRAWAVVGWVLSLGLRALSGRRARRGISGR